MTSLGLARSAARTWTDPDTGRRVRMLSHGTKGGGMSYFRCGRHIPGGLMIVGIDGKHVLIDAATGDYEPIKDYRGHQLKLLRDGTLLNFDYQTREFIALPLPGGNPRVVGTLPENEKAQVADISCDGRTALLLDNHDPLAGELMPTTKDVERFWRYTNRPRHGALVALDLASGKRTVLYESDGYQPFHVEGHLDDPGLVRFAIDRYEGYNQRAFLVRTDGSGLRKVHPQEYGQLITHEFWWPDGKHIGYTYQDRRKDSQIHELPWCEYSPSQTRLGIADLEGRNVYLSEPINHYHTHLLAAHNGKLVSGSGTDCEWGVFASHFSFDNPRVDYVKLATIHTPYVPFRGQNVNCDFDHTGRWLLYADTIDGAFHLCAVEVDI